MGVGRVRVVVVRWVSRLVISMRRRRRRRCLWRRWIRELLMSSRGSRIVDLICGLVVEWDVICVGVRCLCVTILLGTCLL